MKIYHYTSIGNLALILKSRKFRFTRLDKVDDPEEYKFFIDGEKLAKYVFIACFIKNEKESMPQWKMYGDNGRGVRIAFNDPLFDIIIHNNKRYLLQNKEENNFSIFPLLDDNCLHEIQYVRQLEEKSNSIVYGDCNNRVADFKKIGIFKTKDWGFQGECRFILHIFPKCKNVPDYWKSNINGYIISNNIINDFTFIDVPISDEQYNKIEITIGPNATESDRTMLRSLVKMYLGESVDFKESIFLNKYHETQKD